MLKRLLVLLVLAAGLIASNVEAQKKEISTSAYPADNYAVTYTWTVDFSSDSLKQVFSPLAEISGYWGTYGSITVKATGTTPKFSLSYYFADFLKAQTDTTWGVVAGTFDTAGVYLSKPVSDTLNLVTGTGNSLPHRYGYLAAKGLSGNREDVILTIAVTIYKKQG